MEKKDFISTTELAKMLGISRVAIFKKIKNGQIKAVKVGRSFIIDKKDISDMVGNVLSDDKKRDIEQAVEKTVNEYGETLRLLGRE